jgi:16S rRNA (cytosine967-C5)-methyltransferase
MKRIPKRSSAKPVPQNSRRRPVTDGAPPARRRFEGSAAQRSARTSLKGRPNRADAAPSRDHDSVHVAPLDVLARSTVEIAREVEVAVLQNGKHADRAIASLLRLRRDLALPDHRFISDAVFALFRWRGWIDPVRLARIEERMLMAWLLDAKSIHPVCRVWARVSGRDPARLVPLGDAPTWTARAEGLKRWLEGRPVTADPWRLFPTWFRDQVPLPPGTSSPKARYLELLHALQSRPPLWVRAQGSDERAAWLELGAAGWKPWIHRHVTRAAKLDPSADVHHLAPFERGELEIQDLGSQAVGLICDPDPGDRWWDVCAGAGGKAIHLAALMGGKGVVVATDLNAHRLKEAARRARRSPFRNVTTKVWDGRHVAGKSRSFDGVLVDAPCSAIGTWRRNPDARWSLDPQAITRLAEIQFQTLDAAAPGVRVGGALIYSVCTLTTAETTSVVTTFLEKHPEFQLDPFPHPLVDGSPTNGTLQIWPQDADSDAMFVARLVRRQS